MAYSMKLVLREDKADSNGRCPIFLRVTVDRKSSYLFTGVNVKPQNWKDNKQTIKTGLLSHAQDNGLLEWYAGSAKTAVLELLEAGKLTSASVVEKIKEDANTEKSSSTDFFSYCRELVLEAKERGQVSVYVNYNKTVNRLAEYTKQKQIPIYSMDHTFARKFDTWMVSTYGNTGSTINKYFDTLRAFINRAIREKRFEGQNPLLGYRTKEAPILKDRLTKEELRRF